MPLWLLQRSLNRRAHAVVSSGQRIKSGHRIGRQPNRDLAPTLFLALGLLPPRRRDAGRAGCWGGGVRNL